MKGRYTRSLGAAGVLLGAIAGTLLLAVEWDASQPPGMATLGLPAPITTLPMLAAFARYQAAVDRPLFDPSRRPVPPPAPPPPAPQVVATLPPPVSPATDLLGVLIAPEGRFALLRLTNGQTSTVREGDRIGPWTVFRISAQDVALHAAAVQVDVVFPVHGASPGDGPLLAETVSLNPVRKRR